MLYDPRALRLAALVSLVLALPPLQLLAAPPSPEEKEARSDLVLTIDSPEDRAVVGDPGGMGFVSGKAMAPKGELEHFDIMLVVDRSASTSEPSGGDIDRDGTVGKAVVQGGAAALFQAWVPSSDEDDTILAAEILAAGTLLEQLDPRTTRVGVIGFAGDGDPQTVDASVYAHLTRDYQRVRQALTQIVDDGASGRTNMAAAIRLATLELARGGEAADADPSKVQRIVMFLTDGKPTLPGVRSLHENRRQAVIAAREAGQLGVRIDTFAIGAEAIADSRSTIEMARLSNGVFTPVMEPDRLGAVFEGVDFADIDALEIVNRRTGRAAELVSHGADGSYAALVPLEPGENEVEVYARSSTGRELRRNVSVTLLAGTGVQPLTPRLREVRNRLLQTRLARLRERRIEVRTARDRDAMRALELDMQEARERRTERALDVRAVDSEPDAPRP